ncbi:MAG: bifunctional 5,10-methylenetetrahydrofolate dehydrogenase/5,10-methenyltetrahydrofolate cyclohydrolase [Chloroflexi bacterium]|nr:bifunctional 5,10-methylenetetrahydrofolate dehydrogenase/5,10-methenyltetrahydrofolate cyclohydrolase [Chloroflexota bacterium]
MEAQILDGKAIAKQLKEEIATEVESFKAEHGYAPGIAVVLAGADPASQTYAKQILKSFDNAGMTSQLIAMDADTTKETLQAKIIALNEDPMVSGIIVQMPLPAHLAQSMVTDVLSPDKDVDGIHPVNAGRLMLGLEAFVPATPAGGMEILHRAGVQLKGKRAVVVGRSAILGKPMAMLLLAEHATVTICHSRTVDLGSVIREGDVLAACVGKAHMITGDMIKPGAVVIDFGINYIGDKMVGDVDFEQAKEVASAITPVPGGTGPVTNAMLLKNTLMAAKRLAVRAK